MLCYVGMSPQLEELLLEQINLELTIRDHKESAETSNRLRRMIGRIELGIKQKYREIPQELKKAIYLNFLSRELERRRFSSAKPDCSICKNFYDLEEVCKLYPERFEEMMDEYIAICPGYSPKSKAAEQESKIKKEQKMEIVRQLIKEIEQKP